MATTAVDDLQGRAHSYVEAIVGARVIDTEAVAGGGSLPGFTIPSVGVAVAVANPDDAVARLRGWGVVARIDDGAVVCDLRTVDPCDDAHLAAALAAVTNA